MKPSDFQKTIQCQFDCKLKRVVKGIVRNYRKELKRRRNREISYCELPEIVVEKLAVWDEYESDYTAFDVCGIEVRVLDDDLAEAIKYLSEKDREILLMYFFLGMSDHASGTELDAAGVKAMFAGGLANVQKQTKAQKGDKTMMDALIPAVEAIQACPSDDIKEILEAGAKAALAGAASTVEMKANFGRARNYGERSVGYADSGATSWSCMFESFAQAL